VEERQGRAWAAAGYRVVRLREPSLAVTSEWDLLLPATYRSYRHEDLGATIALQVLEGGRTASMAEQPIDRAVPMAPQGWWIAVEPTGGMLGGELGRWRTYVSVCSAHAMH
jgi:hypothetical protein